ncbi:hypothetical protein J4732_13630 [Serratia marcescens]|uniref:Uncharacterized protein n=1 Tax=Serratia marcescens TaxID=615 RepID=A0A939STI9_SERMA|nr:hypothetical protein [Serratia marcescens]
MKSATAVKSPRNGGGSAFTLQVGGRNGGCCCRCSGLRGSRFTQFDRLTTRDGYAGAAGGTRDTQQITCRWTTTPLKVVLTVFSVVISTAPV